MPDPSLVPPDGQPLRETLILARAVLKVDDPTHIDWRRVVIETADALESALAALHEAEQRERYYRQCAETQTARGDALEAFLSEARQERDHQVAVLEARLQDAHDALGLAAAAEAQLSALREGILKLLDEDDALRPLADHFQALLSPVPEDRKA